MFYLLSPSPFKSANARKKRPRLKTALRIAFLLFLFAGFNTIGQARTNLVEKPKWEWGIFGSDITIPHYPGSNEYYHRTLLLPYAVYRFEHIDAGRAPKLFFTCWTTWTCPCRFR